MVTLKIRFGLDSVTAESKDKLVAPKISALSAPNVPELSVQPKRLLSTFIFNFNLFAALSNKRRQFAFNVIRKTCDALDEYCRAADSLRDYIKARGLVLSHYFSAMRHFEHCVAHVYQAVCCMNALSVTWSGRKQFDRGDGSILERVHIIHSEIKHMDERFDKGDFGDEASCVLFSRKTDDTKSAADTAAVANVPIWLTNDGIECAKGTVTYVELAQEISDFYIEAEKMATLTPGMEKGDV